MFSTKYFSHLTIGSLAIFTYAIIQVEGEGKNSVLFVCLGGICRSPMAAAIFRHLLKEKGLDGNWTVDCAAHGYFHVGDNIDPRAVKVLACHDIDFENNHVTRQLTDQDYTKYNYMLGLDDGDVQGLEMKAPANNTASIALLGSYDPKGKKSINDPYYVGNSTIFENCFQQCYRSCNGFLESIVS